MKDFYMILPSNGCANTHPNNNASNFTIEWDSPYDLSGNWKVALTEFKCNFPIYTIPEDAKVTIETVDAPIGTIKKDIIFFEKEPYLDGRLTIVEKDGKFTIKNNALEKMTTFGLRFTSVTDAKKLGFKYDEIVGAFEIRADDIHNLNDNEEIKFRLFSYDFPSLMWKISPEDKLYNDKVTFHPKAKYRNKIELEIQDEILTFRLKNTHMMTFGLAFATNEDAKKVGFNTMFNISYGHITGTDKCTLKDGEYVNFNIFNPKFFIPRNIKEYQISSTDKYFQTTASLVNFLKNADTPLKFSTKAGKIQIECDEDVHKIDFSFPLQYVLGFQRKYKPNKIYIADFKPQLDRAYNNLYIYSDIVSSTYVGGTLAPLVKSLNISKSLKFGEEMVFEIPYPLYTDVSKSTVNQIVVNIRDSNGKLIPFSQSAVTTLTLHFKQL